jgi:hypothetical protein
VPVYDGAEIVGMRAEQLLTALASNPAATARMLAMFTDDTPEGPSPEPGTPLDEEPPPGSRTLVHSGRSNREVIQSMRAAFLLRQARRPPHDRGSGAAGNG